MWAPLPLNQHCERTGRRQYDVERETGESRTHLLLVRVLDGRVVVRRLQGEGDEVSDPARPSATQAEGGRGTHCEEARQVRPHTVARKADHGVDRPVRLVRRLPQAAAVARHRADRSRPARRTRAVAMARRLGRDRRPLPAVVLLALLDDDLVDELVLVLAPAAACARRRAALRVAPVAGERRAGVRARRVGRVAEALGRGRAVADAALELLPPHLELVARAGRDKGDGWRGQDEAAVERGRVDGRALLVDVPRAEERGAAAGAGSGALRLGRGGHLVEVLLRHGRAGTRKVVGRGEGRSRRRPRTSWADEARVGRARGSAPGWATRHAQLAWNWLRVLLCAGLLGGRRADEDGAGERGGGRSCAWMSAERRRRWGGAGGRSDCRPEVQATAVEDGAALVQVVSRRGGRGRERASEPGRPFRRRRGAPSAERRAREFV